MFVLIFHKGQLEPLGQFETRVYSSFQQVAHVQMGLKKLFIFKFTEKLFCIIGIMIVFLKALWVFFFLPFYCFK